MKKKKISIAVIAIAAVLALGFGMVHSNASQAEPKLSVDDVKQFVNDQYPGTIKEIELEKDQNKAVYEVEILGEGKKYELKLDGNSGEVLKIEEKTLMAADEKGIDLTKTEDGQTKNTKKNEAKQHGKKAAKEPAKSAVIDIKEASEIALNEFSGTITDVELDEEDGRLVYEIEIKAKGKEAEIEIDAYTGEILVLEIDTDDDYDD